MDFSLFAALPHVALVIFDLCAPKFGEELDARCVAAVCFLLAQKAVDVRVMSSLDVEHSFVVRQSDIVKAESDIFDWLSQDVSRLLASTRRPDVEMLKAMGQFRLDAREREDAWKFFNMSSIDGVDGLAVRVHGAVLAAIAWHKTREMPPASQAVVYCRDRMLSHASHEHGTRLAITIAGASAANLAS